MLANFFMHKEKTADNRNLLLQKEFENPMDGTCGQRGKIIRQMKYPGELMRKKGLVNSTLREHTEFMKDR